MKRLKIGTVLGLGLIGLLGLIPLSAVAANLLTNGALNEPYVNSGRTWDNQPEKIASGWSLFFVDSGTYKADENAPKLHWMSSKQFADRFGGVNYGIEGDSSGGKAQNLWSAYEFDAGIYQQIPATPGQDYGFDIAIVTFWRGPGYPVTNGLMVKQVGIDPLGGTDPTSSSVVWSETNAADKDWAYMDVAATAGASTITVFARVQAPENESPNHTDLDMVYFDVARVDLAPSTNLNASTSGNTINLSWSGSIVSSDPAWSIKGYEVQYRDQAGGDWVTLQAKDNKTTSGAFAGVPGHTYSIRARTWQVRSEPYNSDIDMPGVWQTKTATAGAAVSGRVTTNRDQGLSGVKVTGSGGASATSGADGAYTLAFSASGNYTVTAETIAGWTAPPPVAVSVTIGQVAAVSLTLRPPDDAIRNGDFEAGLNNWSVSGQAPAAFSTGRRNGSFSLRLTDTLTLSQTGLISGSYQPVLSFWYRVASGDGDDVFSAEILGTSALTPTNLFTDATPGEWRHAWLPLDLSEVYTGPVGVRFGLNQNGPTQAVVYLDEVSLGGSFGGPNHLHLPLVMK